MSARAAAPAKPKAGPCPACAAAEKSNDCCAAAGVIRRAPLAGGAPRGGAVPASVARTLRQSGRPLDPATRARMEHGFGQALGQVPVRAEAPAGPLRLGRVDDPAEAEADRLAARALSPPSAVAGLAAPGAVAGPAAPSAVARPAAPSAVTNPVAPARRVDFAAVRIHDDPAAAASARAIGARAYAVGHQLVFGAGRFAPTSTAGARLLAHELAHSLQASPATVRRDGGSSVFDAAFAAVDARRWEDAARLANGLSGEHLRYFIDTIRREGGNDFIWQLHVGALGASGVGAGSAVAQATKATYDKVSAARELAYQQRLAAENGTPPPTAAQSGPASSAPVAPPSPMTVERKLDLCRIGQVQNPMIFPLRMSKGLWRYNVAPITARRTGDEIHVKQPLNGVGLNSYFKKDTKTLPLNTFLGGIKLKPDDVVRVRVYDDNEKIICVTGADMLKLSDESDRQTLIGVGRTVLDATAVMTGGATAGLSRGGQFLVGAAFVGAGSTLEGLSQYSMVQTGLKDKVDWAGIAFDAALQLLTLGLGGALTSKATAAVAAKVQGTYSREIVALVVKTILQGGFAAFQSAARLVFDGARGARRDMTWEELAGLVAEQFVVGALSDLVMSLLSQHGAAPDKAQLAAKGGPVEPPTAPTTPRARAPKAPARGAGGEPQQDAAHPGTGPRGAKPRKTAVLKEEAIAREPLPDGHEAVVTRDGVARCSPSPCPVITIEYAQELAREPDLKRRSDAVDALRGTDPDKAAIEARDLIRDLEITRRNAANVPRVGGEMPTNPDRRTSRAEWRRQESLRRWANAVDKAFDAPMEAIASTPAVKGTEKSGFTIDDHRVPQTRQRRVDLDADPAGPDFAIPRRSGESGAQALARIRTVIGKKISDIPVLDKLWNEARASVESREALTADNYAELYDRTRNAFWRRVTAKTPDGAAARAALEAVGLGFAPGKRGAARLQGIDPAVKDAEITVSLDHVKEKAQGDNWRHALDADNLELTFSMPNTNREVIQVRHGMRE